MPLSSDVEKYQEQVNRKRLEQLEHDLTCLKLTIVLAILTPAVIIWAYILLR